MGLADLTDINVVLCTDTYILGQLHEGEVLNSRS